MEELKVLIRSKDLEYISLFWNAVIEQTDIGYVQISTVYINKIAQVQCLNMSILPFWKKNKKCQRIFQNSVAGPVQINCKYY